MVRSWYVASDLPAFDVRPILTAERHELVDLLSGLDDEAWRADTACVGWSVHDVALHLLGNDFGRIAPPSAASQAGAEDFRELAATIERKNEDWVTIARAKIPAAVVPDQLALMGRRVDAALAAVDLLAPGVAVLWTGSGPTPYWLDIAREYTERWVHHAQIREAVGKPPLLDRRWLHPVLDAFMRSLPLAYEDVAAPIGTSVAFIVTGDAGDRWWVERRSDRWYLTPECQARANATVEVPADSAWRLMTRLGDVAAARATAVISGSQVLGEAALAAVAVMTTQL